MEAYMDVDSRLGGDLGGLLLSYTPLVRATAHRYMGRGAEFDDLVQEGYLALLLLIPRCGDREWLPLFLKSRLPGYVRAVAKKLRSGGGVFDLEEIEEVVRDEYSASQREERELRAMLERVLSKSELDITQALMEGFTQREIAEILGLTQQAVAARLRKIREKLKPQIAFA